MADCKKCRHYSFYRMITEGPYGYAGVIPCTTCSRFTVKADNYEPVAEIYPIKATTTTNGKTEIPNRK